MSTRNIYIAIGLILAFGMFCGIVAYAQDTAEGSTQDANQDVTIRFDAPVQIPGGVLPAGTYQFKPVDSDEGVVQVFNANGTSLRATLQTVAAERLITDEDLVVTVAGPNSSNPSFLVKWFYPGRLVGREVLYSDEQEQQVAEATSRTSVGSQVIDGTPVNGN